ncbi:6142_t:CDS:2 [Ambispora leptoticha]|uniref:6142_t:CDS:1 n=1 Tax=Ambispora leptoticha TaxID=144679 RepID=A0A9N9C8C4_9GLOM|nr:6142_t:CDS:2 [Ambispora leptoticha]
MSGKQFMICSGALRQEIYNNEASENQKYRYQLPRSGPPDVIVPIPIRPGGNSNANQQPHTVQLRSIHMQRQFTFSEFKRKKSTQAQQSTLKPALLELLQYKDSDEEKEGKRNDETQANTTNTSNLATNPEMINTTTTFAENNNGAEQVSVMKNDLAKDDDNHNKINHKNVFNTKNAMELALRIANQFVVDDSKDVDKASPNNAKIKDCDVNNEQISGAQKQTKLDLESFLADQALQSKIITYPNNTRNEPQSPTLKNQKTFACPNCNRQFNRKFNMQSHLLTHNPNRTKPFRCEVEGCASTFTRKHDLKRHVNGIHKCEKLYQCPACLRNFSRKDAWKRHLIGCAPPTVEIKNVQPIGVELRRKIVELID